MDAHTRRVSSLFVTLPMLFSVGLCLFLSLYCRQEDLIILSILVFAVMGGLRLWGSFSLSRIQCAVRLDKARVFAGERLLLDISVENGKPLPVWLAVTVPMEGLQHAETGDKRFSAESGLLWYQGAIFRWELLALARGVHEIGPLHVVSGDFFGFFPKEEDRGEPFQVIVYPRLVRLGSSALPRRDFFGIAGADGPVKDPVYILGTTDYHQGRPAKHIHWKASARHQRIQEKVYESSAQEKCLLVVDVASFEGEAAAGPFERALEVAASLAVQLDRRGSAVGLLTNGAMTGMGSPYLRVTRSGAQVTSILESLARLRASSTGEISDLVNRGLSLPWGASCIYLAFGESAATGRSRAVFRRLKVPVTFLTGGDISAMTKAGRCDASIQEPHDAREREALAV